MGGEGADEVTTEPGGVDQGDDPASPVSADGDDSPSALDRYRALVAADTNKGDHSKASAEPIVRAAYACDPIIPTKVLAADLGHPVGTVLTWASRLGLTQAARRGGPERIGQRRDAAEQVEASP